MSQPCTHTELLALVYKLGAYGNDHE